MDPCQNNLPVTAGRQSFDFLKDILFRTAEIGPAHIGHTAITAKLVTTVLDFDKGPAMLLKTLNAFGNRWIKRQIFFDPDRIEIQ